MPVKHLDRLDEAGKSGTLDAQVSVPLLGALEAIAEQQVVDRMLAIQALKGSPINQPGHGAYQLEPMRELKPVSKP